MQFVEFFDYTHWHGTYEVVKHFYAKFVPALEDLIEKGQKSNSGKPILIMFFLSISTQTNGINYTSLQSVMPTPSNAESVANLKSLEKNVENASNNKASVVSLASLYLQNNQNSKLFY